MANYYFASFGRIVATAPVCLLAVSTARVAFAQTEFNYPGGGTVLPADAGANTFLVASDHTNTWVNAPSATGSVFFGSGNGTGDPGNPTVQVNASGLVDVEGVIEVQGYDSILPMGAGIWAQGSGAALYASTGSGYGAYGTTANGYPKAGVYGTSTSAGSIGVEGTANGSQSMGVWGTTDVGLAGVQGYGSGTGSYGVSGVAGGSNGHAIDAICNGSCASNGWAGYFTGRVNITTGLEVAGSCRFGSCTSDERLKKNIHPITGSLDVLTRLRPVTYEWKNPEEHGGNERTQRGFIAQEVEKVVPDWVGVNEKGFKTLDMVGLEPMLVDGMRALKMGNDELKMENNELRERVRALESTRGSARAGFGDSSAILLGFTLVAGALFAGLRGRPAR